MRGVILSPGHGPGTSRAAGSSFGGINEYDVCCAVADEAAALLAEREAEVFAPRTGPYSGRTNGLPHDIAISLHTDIQRAKTPYALALVHRDESEAWDAALCILDRLCALPEYDRGIIGVWGTGEPEGTAIRRPDQRPGYVLQTVAWSDANGPICIDAYGPHSPRMLLELGSLAHASHSSMLSSQAGQRRVALAIVDGILDYL